MGDGFACLASRQWLNRVQTTLRKIHKIVQYDRKGYCTSVVRNRCSKFNIYLYQSTFLAKEGSNRGSFLRQLGAKDSQNLVSPKGGG